MSKQSVDPRGTIATGTAEWIPNRTGGGKYVARITSIEGGNRIRLAMLDDGGMPLFTDKERDKEKAHRYAREMSKQARDVQAQSPGIDPTGKTMVTVEAFGLQWTSGALLKKHGEVKRLKEKKTARGDHNLLARYIYLYIGKMPIGGDVIDDQVIERTFAKAQAAFLSQNGRPMSQATKRHMYMTTHRLFDLAIKPGRLRNTNPVSEDLLPAKGAPKLYGFLYPQELLDLLGCTDIPIARRVYYAIGAYTGLRKASLRAFTWDSIDFEHKTIISLVSKTEEHLGPQMFAQSDPQLPGLCSLIEVLRRYRELQGWPDDDASVIVHKELRMKKDAEASTLRMDLECAGVTRKVLFTKSDKIEPLRFHDLRATFVTWARRAYKGDGWISDRTGQITKDIMRRYDRGARSLADLQLEPFPDISKAIPELAALNITRLSGKKR